MSSESDVDFFSSGANGAKAERKDSLDMLDDGDGTGFAAQLRKHRKQVLRKDEPPVGNFANALRVHRGHLVDAWEDNHVEQNTTENGDDTNDDDSFGSFDKAPTQTEIVAQNGHQDYKQSTTATNGGNAVSLGDTLTSQLDDAFGSFDQAPTPAVVPSMEAGGDSKNLNGTETNHQIVSSNEDSDEDFGEFGAAPSLPAPSGTEDNAKDDTFGDFAAAEDTSEPDDFGDFDAAPAVAPQPEGGNSSEDDPFGAFNAVPVQSEPLNNTDGDNDANDEDDDFGDFDAAPAVAPQPEDGNSSEDDPFSAFDAVPTIQSESLNENVGEGNAGDDDDFGDFDTAPVVAAPQTAKDDSGEADVSGAFDTAPSEPEMPNGIIGGETCLSQPDGDFDGVDAAPSQPEDPSNITEDQAAKPDNNDLLGDFGAPLTQPDGDDAFGDFDPSPSTLSKSQNTQSEEKQLDDAFDDFHAASPSQAEPPNDATDDFGDCGAALTTEPQSAGANDDDEPISSTAVENDTDDDDDFGDFGAAPAVETPVDNVDDDDFGDFDAPSSQPEPVTGTFEEKDTADDDFGDFGAAPAVETPADNADDDDFGDFDAVPSQPEPVTSTVEEKDTADDDFGDFGAAPAVETPADNADDDDFGNFDAVPSQPEPVTSTVEEKDAADDDFGDFGAAPSSQPEPENDADDFGDFGAAPTVETPADNAGDDDFGDFDAAPSSQPEPKNDVDDDFGDFGTAPTAEPQVEDTKDDDFGDFDAAPSSQAEPTARTTSEEKSKDDDAGFGAFDTASTPNTVLPPIGTVSQGKRNLFAKMQSRYSFLDSDQSGGVSIDASIGEEGLADFLATTKSAKVHSGFREEDGMYQVLSKTHVMAEGVESTSIIKSDGRGPYDCFVYPLAGFRAPRTEIVNDKQLRRHSSTRAIPDVLPIRLPSGKDTPVSFRDSKKIPNNSTKSAQIPDLNAPNLDGGYRNSKTSTDVQTFLSKIPDLSFMLQSKLQLPTE